MDILSSLLGAFIETFLILMIGFYLIGLELKNRLIAVSIVSFYGSVLIIMLKSTLSLEIYLLILVLCLGILLALILNFNILHCLLLVFFGSLCLLIAESISFALILLISKPLNIQDHFLELHPLIKALPHWTLLMITYLFLKKKEIQIVKGKQLGKIPTIHLANLGIIGSLTLYFIWFYERHNEYIINYLSTGFFIGSTITISYLFKVGLNRNMAEIARKNEEQYEEDEKQYISLVESQRHDFIHHLLAAHGMLSEGNNEMCKNYLNEVLNEASVISEVLPLKSSATSGLLLAYKMKARQKGVTINYSILDNLAEIPCKTFETNRILGNLIQNAIEEAEKTIKKEVAIYIRKSKKSIQIEVSNYGDIVEFSNNIDKIFLRGFSTKDYTENQGAGLVNVYKIVEKYNGSIFPEIKNELIVFTVTIPIKVRVMKI
ncbi:GHKL domain-containing protein [Bacillus aquiflavi]|uniref:sensor histidine kinase n=1 Tax=Bacillus aquiflavi TaxID=2672567 RepID=UPI001CA7CE14|nr:GHKL domain-containing protein [Bacillus aquiflavi]UAC48032.1 GHKL domain-containing protein [Bacillus aquiflavi]